MKILKKGLQLDHFFSKVKEKSLLMLDYDGTLAPLIKERMQAYPYPGIQERLTSLIQLPNARIVIISGRSLSDLEALLSPPSHLELWGSHGLERKQFDGKKVHVMLDANIEDGLQQGIRICYENIAPEYFEIKPYSVALHWRGIVNIEQLQKMKTIETLWEKLCKRHHLEIHHFDEGIELRPRGTSKGNVIETLLKEVPQGTAIAYLGDDMTDEEAFAALGNRGLKVLVRQELRKTLADLFIIPPEELLAFLDRWRGE